MSDNDDKLVELYGLNDGYGIVGFGYTCPHCGHSNEFIDEEDETHICSKCSAEIKVRALKWTVTTKWAGA